MEVKTPKQRIFLESPYDIETIFESLNIASKADKELLFVDKLVSYIRLDPTAELTTLNYRILKDLQLIDTMEI